ncbi:integrase core domain-containing protein [Streptomyces sp. NBC_01255]|nr:integrase core domain-containing protein [Streptomyces sp. NBC_01255]
MNPAGAWSAPAGPSSRAAVRTVTDALVEDAVRRLALRTKVFHDGPWRTVSDVEYATASWVEWYNNRRLHSSLGMISPTEFETAHSADTEPRAD